MSKQRYWYRVEMLSGSDTYCFFGSCKLPEKELMQALQENKWTLIEDLIYFDENDRAQGWSEWDPNYLARIHLNPQYVVSVMPMLEDPRKETVGANDILTLPMPSNSHENNATDKSDTSTITGKKNQRDKKGKTDAKSDTFKKPKKKK